MTSKEILGTTTVSKRNKMTLIAKVSKALGVDEGDTIVFYREYISDPENKLRIYIEGGVSSDK